MTDKEVRQRAIAVLVDAAMQAGAQQEREEILAAIHNLRSYQPGGPELLDRIIAAILRRGTAHGV